MNSSQEATTGRHTVLVGTDGSDDGTRAVRYGARVALQTDGSLRVVTVADMGAYASAWGVMGALPEIEEAAQRVVDAAVTEARRAGLDASRTIGEVATGAPGATLAKLSKDADLLVVGRRSLRGLERMFVGSTSVAVADEAVCPVVVVSAATTPEDPGARGRITVAVTSPDHAPRTLAWAFEAARTRHAAVTVLHAVGWAAPGSSVQIDDGWVSGRLEEVVQPLREQYPEVSVETRVEGGSPVHVLGDASAESDLLVLGRPRPGLRVGGTMRAVLAHAACPVVVVH